MKRYPLPLVLGGLGFRENKRKSSQHSSFMVHEQSGLKLVVSLNTNGHWRFFPVGAHGRGGTVIDALQLIMGYTIGEARKHMRPLLSGTLPASTLPDPKKYSLNLKPVASDIADVRRVFMQSVTPIVNGRHPYLNDVRKLSPALLTMPQFAGALFMDNRRNAVFPHRDRGGEIVGAELRNHKFQGQIKGGKKTLWHASPLGQEEREHLVIAESAIDACSYAALFYCPKTVYLSTGGTLSPLQKELIGSAIRKRPIDRDGQVTIATDNDDAGRDIAQTLLDVFKDSGRDDLTCRIHHPDTPGCKDWNDVLIRTVAPSSLPSLDQ